MIRIGDQAGIAGELSILARIEIAEGCTERGVRLAGAHLQLMESIAAASDPIDEAPLHKCLETARIEMGSEHADHARDEGRVLTMDEAVT